MLDHALVLDALGKPIRHGNNTHSADWDEVQEFCRSVYMPYRVRPLDRLSRPDATMISARAGRVTMTRFAYGTGIHLDRFDPDAGNILVLNTLRGALARSPLVSDFRTTAVARDGALVSFAFVGDTQRLQGDLLQRGVALSDEPDAGWVLRSAVSASGPQ